MINISDNKNLKLGWRVNAIFSVTIHSKDLPLLKEIQMFFGPGVGNIYLESKREIARYVVSDINIILSIIIPHFNYYPLQSNKLIDFQLWQDCVKLIAAKEHLTQLGLEKIVAIRGALNWGLSNKIKIAFPHIKVIPRPPFIINDGRLDPYWISGFSSAESCFCVSVTERQISAKYTICLHNRDKVLLLKIRDFFGSNCNVTPHRINSSEFRVQGIKELNRLILPHFEVYQLSGFKLYNYRIWREIVELISNKVHLTEEGKAKIKKLRLTLNKY